MSNPLPISLLLIKVACIQDTLTTFQETVKEIAMLVAIEEYILEESDTPAFQARTKDEHFDLLATRCATVYNALVSPALGNHKSRSLNLQDSLPILERAIHAIRTRISHPSETLE